MRAHTKPVVEISAAVVSNVPAPSPRVCVVLPLRLPSLANARLHPMAKHRLLKGHKEAAYYKLRARVRGLELPLAIAFVRIGPARLDPDNLAGSFKGVQDGVARALKVDDGDERLELTYGQRRALPGEKGLTRGYGCIVEIWRPEP